MILTKYTSQIRLFALKGMHADNLRRCDFTITFLYTYETDRLHIADASKLLLTRNSGAPQSNYFSRGSL